jgi:hypothetical protein
MAAKRGYDFRTDIFLDYRGTEVIVHRYVSFATVLTAAAVTGGPIFLRSTRRPRGFKRVQSKRDLVSRDNGLLSMRFVGCCSA